MPGGRWIILVAVVGLALGGNVQPVIEGGNGQGSAAERKDNENPKAPRIAPRDQQVSAPNVSPEHERYAEEERQRGRDDLVAQQVSAFWPRVMGIAAVLAIFLSAGGIWLIYTTFRETRRSANAAEKAVSETIRIGEAQVRSYLTVTEAAIRLSVNGPVDARVKVKNSGQSPAQKLKLSCWITIQPLSAKMAGQSFHTESKELFATIAAGAKVTLPPQTPAITMTKEIIDALFDDKRGIGITLMVSLEWRDVFNAKRYLSEGFTSVSTEWPIDEFVVLAATDHMLAAVRREGIRRKRPKEEGGESA